MLAILSDIHANLEAFDAVLRDLDHHKPDRVIILGDTLGYGPDPRPCFRKAAHVADILLAGNHEHDGVIPPPPIELTPDVIALIDWHHHQVAGLPAWQRMRKRLLEGGAAAVATHREDDRLFVHASPEKPVTQYVWPGFHTHYIPLNAPIDTHLAQLLAQFDTHHGFCGHTHTPAVLAPYSARRIFPIHQDYNRKSTFIGPQTVFYVPQGHLRIEGLAEHHVVLNPGSVGQPRDGDPRASYALYDGDSVHIRRVPYDIATTQKKLRAISEPPADVRERQAARLSEGL